MKQHITIEQLNELSKPSLLKLWNWILTNHSDWQENGKNVNLLSIGQMIEFLDYKSFEPYIVKVDIADYWVVEAPISTLGHYEKRELCDALWEAVKNILEKK